MGVRILHAADLHLGRAFRQLGGAAAERQRDLLDTFERICSVAIERQVAALLIAGDLFDTHNPSAGSLGQVEAQLDRLAQQGIRIFVIPGNHDDVWQPNSIWRQRTFTGIHVFREATFTQAPEFEVNGTAVHVHGLAYNYTICPNPLSTLRYDGDGLHIAMMHATVNPPSGFPTEQRYYPLSHDALIETGMDYVALGHIHREHVFKDGDRVIGCYPGSPEGLDPSETGDRHVALLDFTRNSPDVHLLKVNKRTVQSEQLDVTSCAVDDIANRLKIQASKDLLLTVKLIGAPDEVPNVEALQKRLQEHFFWFGIEDATEIVRSEWVEKIAGENTIRGQFVHNLRTRIDASEDAQQRATLGLALKLGLVALQKRSAA